MSEKTFESNSIATFTGLVKQQHESNHSLSLLDSQSTLEHSHEHNNENISGVVLQYKQMDTSDAKDDSTNMVSSNNVSSDSEVERWSELAQSHMYHGVELRHGVEHITLDDGEYIGTVDTHGRLTGYGKMTWRSGDCYAGEWWEDAMHGTGQYTWADGDYYKGEYDHGEMSGTGEMHDRTGLYIGAWAHDTRHGHGTMQYANGNVYTGDWVQGNCDGHGKLFEIDCGTTYEGMFANNEKHGMGIEINADEDVYDGEFAHGQPHGKGTYVWHDGTRYVGHVANGLPHGDGCEWLPNGDWIAGNFINGEHDHVQPLHKAALINNNINISSAISDDSYNIKETLSTVVNTNRLMVELVNSNDGPDNNINKKENTSYADAHSSKTMEEEEEWESTTESKEFHNTPSSTRSKYPFTEYELSQWISVRIVGRGSFGAVHEARLPNGATVCCKVIELGNIDSAEQMAKVRNEMSVMRELSHPNIVQYYGSVESTQTHTLNIFMEFCRAGSLAKELRQRRTGNDNHNTSSSSSSSSSSLTTSPSCPSKLFTNVNELREWSRQVISGIEYLHRHGVIHRDIKCDNILIGNGHELKLADFGCSKAIHDVCSATHGCNTMVGTPYWMAPEVITCEQSESAYGMKSDIWSFGCTIVEMITGKPPWPECNSLWAAVYKIANSTGLPTEIPDDLDEVLRDLLYRCFERNPHNRPTAKELLSHPFFCTSQQS